MIPLEERLKFGNLSVRETYELRGVSHVQFYDDLKAGRVAILKEGHKSLVPGQVAQRYCPASAPLRQF